MKKKLMSLLASVLIITVMQPVTALAAETDQAASPLSQTAQALANLTISQDKSITSLQYALMDGDEFLVSGTAGVFSKSENRALTSEAMYGIGSISKMYTSASVMQLVDQGKVNLDTPVVNYIPDFSMKDPRYKNITPRMLLNHASGLMGTSMNNLLLFNDNDPYYHDHFLETLRDQRLKADPGAYSVYCNDGFTLAEILVERVSGKTFTEYVAENFSNKLGNVNTKTPMDTFDRDNLARTYSPSYEEGATPADFMNMIGAGGIYSTAEELCRFGGTFTRRNNLLSDASVAAMAYPEYTRGLWMENVEDNVIGYGLGWDSVELYPFPDYGVRAWVKGGDSQLYHAGMVVLPDKGLVCVVLSSGGSSTVNEMLASRILLETLLAKGEIKELIPDKSFGKPTYVPLDKDFRKNAGTYMANDGVLNAGFTAAGNLELTNFYYPNMGKETYIHVGKGEFINEIGSAKITFQTLKNGKTYLALEGYAALGGILQTASAVLRAQKMEPNTVPASVQQEWAKRNNKIYLTVNEKYSSQLYLSSSLFNSVGYTDKLPGYVSSYQLKTNNEAQPFVQIPMTFSRDLMDLTFYQENGVEYMKANTFVSIDAEATPVIADAGTLTPQIGANGYAQWYRFGGGAAGRTLSVTVPANASFTVYNAQGLCVNNYTVTGRTTTQLPAAGYLVFAGNAGSQFGATVA